MLRRNLDPKTCLTVILAAAAVALAGCGGDRGAETEDAGIEEGDRAPAERDALTFWRNSGNNAENAAYEQLVARFMEKHPNIAIEMTPYPYSDYDTKLRTAIASGEPPDIMSIDAPNMASYVEAGALLPLTGYFRNDGALDDIPASTMAAYTYKDEIYMAPMTESSIALFYNKRLFDAKGIPYPSGDPESPATWTEVLEAARALTDREKGVYGIDPAQGFQNAGATAYFKYPIVWQFGGEIMSPDGTTMRGYLDSPGTLRAIRFYADLYNKEMVSAFEYPADPFANGHLAMTVEGSWSLSHYAANFPDFKLGVDYDVAPLPMEAKQAVANGSWAIAISSATDRADAAWTFVNFLTGYESQKTYVTITKDIPARYSVAKEIEELNEYPMNIFVVQNQRYGRTRPITPIFPQMAEAVNSVFEDVTIGGREIEDAVNEAIRRVDEAYNVLDSQK
ncbi:sugar ABC transporter substrate-binding protein [Paenibacillus sp.]|uniref:ABC transporter substrate-binding protein n=1 Tax=Paenibacillus sp. TaxID=58172 RepID=UPI0028117438|nr:sugar ABC transporter substrate-binding protein [Paenibacillus sp.]